MIEPPHALAAAIIALPTREERAAALAKVPAAWRDLVRAHVIDHFWRKQSQRRGE